VFTSIRIPVLGACAVLAGTLFAMSASAQVQNPVQAFKDAYKKAKEQQQQPAKPQTQTQAQAQSGVSAPPNLPAQHTASPGQQGATPQAPDFGTTAGTARLAAAGGFVDVSGIKVGMGPKELADALKADNPKFKLTVGHMFRAADDLAQRQQGHPGGTAGPIIGVDARFGDASMVETVEVDLTWPPNAAAVTAVSRSLAFSEGKQPTIENVVAGLRKKYGPESFGPANATFGDQNTYDWLFDTQGQLMKFNRALQMERCTATARSSDSMEYENTLQLSLTPMMQSTYVQHPYCGDFTLVQAQILRDIHDPRLVTTVTVALQNFPLQQSGRSAFQAYAAELARQAKNAAEKDAAKQGAPKF
jgi:hypothetical protein